MRQPPRYDLPRAAPEPLRRVQLFVNTTDHEQSRELLGSPSEVRDWLAASLPGPGPVGGASSPAVRAEVEERARRARLSVTLDGPRLVAEAQGLDGVLGELVAIAYEALRDGSFSRLKS